jgi:YHS domain-containing protein
MSSSVLSLLWWVAIGVLFFWMMSRGGCGMGMGHGRGHGREAERANGHASHGASGKPVDPVCGMEVDPAKAAGTRVANGETFFFCSQTCLDAFDKAPAMYPHRHEDHSQHRAHAGC